MFSPIWGVRARGSGDDQLSRGKSQFDWVWLGRARMERIEMKRIVSIIANIAASIVLGGWILNPFPTLDELDLDAFDE